MPNVKEVGPRQPRIIIYDVDNEITVDDLAEGLQIQNPDLGLNKEDIGRMCVMHKLGPRNGTTTHWVLETPPDVLTKLENKSVFLGMTKCRVRVYQNVPQCFKCQKYGHTAIKCTQEAPICKHCAEGHDSRECPDKLQSKCSNCKKDHKASSAICKSRNQAVQGLLRRTDFGPK